MILLVYDDGGAWVYYNITVENAPANITVKLLAPPLTLYAEDQDQVPLPVSYTNTTATVTVYGSGVVIVRYYTLALTSKEGYSWMISFTPSCPAILVLPGDAVPVKMVPTPTPTLYNGQAALRFPADSHVQVEYYIIPSGAVQSPTTTSQQPAPGTTGTGPEGSSTNAANSGGAPSATMSPQPGATLSTENGGRGSKSGNNLLWMLAAVIVLLVAFTASFSYFRNRSGASGREPPNSPGVEAAISRLDERDRSILEALRERPMTAVELQQATGIPKTPLYRRLKKLLDEGLIEYYEENGVRVYRLKEGR